MRLVPGDGLDGGAFRYPSENLSLRRNPFFRGVVGYAFANPPYGFVVGCRSISAEAGIPGLA